MTRLPARALALGLNAWVLLVFSAHADAGSFNQALATQMFTAAYHFMLPRTLDPVTLPQLTLWGLRGITALDPALTPAMNEQEMQLVSPDRILLVLPLPAPADEAAWAGLAAGMLAAAWDHSDALPRAGTEGVIASFFDEVFNHLDPYSRYIPPAAAEAERDRRSGHTGLGLELEGAAGVVRVQSVQPGSPAAAANIKPGDLVLAIGAESLAATDATTAAALLNGESAVTVTLRHAGHRIKARIAPALLVPNTLEVSAADRLLVIRIASFTAETAYRLQAVLSTAVSARRQPLGIVIDLRANRGGVLREAVAVASLFIAHGTIATTEGRNPASRHAFAADGADQAYGLPLVVLVDGRSASAAEVLTAALEDNGRAVVVGSTTLGKGLVQVVGAMPGGGELFVTWSRLIAPAGWPLQGLGVMPEVCTSEGLNITESVLDALQHGSAPMQQALASHRAVRPGLPAAEMLVLRDRCPAAIGTDTDMATARFLVTHPVAYATALLSPP